MLVRRVAAVGVAGRGHPVARAQPALDEWVAAVRHTGIVGGSIERTRVLDSSTPSGYSRGIAGNRRAIAGVRRCGAARHARALRRHAPRWAGVAGAGRDLRVPRPPRLPSGAGSCGTGPASRTTSCPRRCSPRGSARRGPRRGPGLAGVCRRGHAAALTLPGAATSGAGQGAGSAVGGGEPERARDGAAPVRSAVSTDDLHVRLAEQRGNPAAARLRSPGALLYHGDFDGEGLRIAAYVVARTGPGPGGCAARTTSAGADGPPVGRSPRPVGHGPLDTRRRGDDRARGAGRAGLLDELPLDPFIATCRWRLQSLAETGGEAVEPIRVPPECSASPVAAAGLYVSVLHAFGEANERLETALSLDDVRARLRAVGWLDVRRGRRSHHGAGPAPGWRLVDVTQNHAENYRTARSTNGATCSTR